MRCATNELGLKDSAFDALAENYDASFTKTALGKYLRSAVWKRYDSCFAGRKRLLDIGCGTGEDAIYLARRGHEVLATDASPAMLELAADKAERSGCSRRITFRRVPMEHLSTELAGERFEGVCSNFGAINCAPRVDKLAADVAKLLSPGAPLLWVVMGRHVPWEWAWFLARADWRKAFRRLRPGGAAFRGVRIRYPSPGHLSSVLMPHFGALRSWPLGLLLPPTYASAWIERSPRLFAALKRFERVTSPWQPLATFADHYVIEAQRLPVQQEREGPS